MVRLKKAASAIKAPSRAKPTPQPDADYSPSDTSDQRETKTSTGQHRKPSGTRKTSKKLAPRSGHNTTKTNASAIDGEENDDDNDGNDDNDPVEEDEEEANNNEENDDQENEEEEEEVNANANETNVEQSDANEEEEEDQEEEDPYKQAETKMLLVKTKLLLVEQKNKKAGSLRREVARSEQRLISEVRELRDWLTNEIRKQEAAGGKKKKKKSSLGKKAKPDPNKLWAIHGIIKETTYHYLVVWKGEDEHGQPWEDSWVTKREVNAAAKRDWAALRAEVAAGVKKKRKEWVALEEARKKAEGRSRASRKGQVRDEDGIEDEDEDEGEGDDEDVDEDEDE